MFHVVIILMEAEKIWMVLIFSNYLQDVHIKDSFIKKIVRLLNHFERRRCDFPIRLHLSWDLSRNAFVHFFQSWSLYSTNVGQSELPLGSPFFQLPFSSLIRPTPVEAPLRPDEELLTTDSTNETSHTYGIRTLKDVSSDSLRQNKGLQGNINSTDEDGSLEDAISGFVFSSTSFLFYLFPEF